MKTPPNDIWARLTIGLLVIAAIAMMMLGSCGCQTAMVTHGIPNLRQVEPGVWRGGQPTDEGWRWLHAQGVRVVVKLNPESEASDAAAEEPYGMIVWRLPLTFGQQLGTSKIPKDYFVDAVAAFPLPQAQRSSFGLMPDQSVGNVFIHCQHGQDRTGLFVACYRVAGHQEHWTKAAAEKEMLANGFHKELVGLWEYWENFKP